MDEAIEMNNAVPGDGAGLAGDAPLEAAPAMPMPAVAAPAPPSAREAALRVLMRIEGSDARAKESIDEALKLAPYIPEDAALLQELVYATLRARSRLDYQLSKVSHRPLEALSPWVRNLLRLALVQVLEMDRIPEAAAVDTAVEIAKLNGHDGVVKFVNGVLRELCRQKAEDKLAPLPRDPVTALAIRCSHPFWMAERLVSRYGFDKAEALMAASDQAAPLTLRVDTSRHRRDEIASRLLQQGLHVEPCRFSIWGLRVREHLELRRLPGFHEGDFHVQDESSQLVARLLDLKPGDQVADVCAAPGGKAAHLAELVGKQGRVWAFDRKHGALDKLLAQARRQSQPQLACETRDGMRPKEELFGRLDAVLVDAPCSGLGVLRRRVEARWQVREDGIRAQADRQLRLLRASSRYLKPGGVLVYATCTLEPEENEDVAARFLDQEHDFVFERAHHFLERELCTPAGFFQVWPGHDQMDGFFAARFRRVR